MDFNIAEATITHFNQLFAEIRDAIARFPDKSWNLEPTPEWERSNPAVCAFHTVFSMSYPHLFHLPAIREKYEGLNEKTKVQPKTSILELLGEIVAAFHEKFGKMEFDQFMEKLEGHKMVTYEQLLYSMAHSRYHLGQLTQLLKNEHIEEPPWYPIRD